MKISVFVFFLLFSISGFTEERAPQAEPPYPEYPQPRHSKKHKEVEQPKKVDSSGTYYYDTDASPKKPKTRPGVEAPVDVTSDGTYYYSTSGHARKRTQRSGVEQPKDVDSDGTYYYSTESQQSKPKAGVEKPTRIESDGTYVYGDADNEGYDSTFYFNVGMVGPFEWSGGNQPGSLTYRDVYSNQGKFLLHGGYEWKMFDFLGALLVRIDSGLFFAEGKGQFNGTNNVNSGLGLQPKETFQLILMPNTLSLVYKFESSPSQYFIPYISGGAGYFTFWERRTDDEKNSFGGAPVLNASAGLKISLKMFNKLLGTHSIDSEYGVNHSWLNLQYRRIVGLDERKDLSSNMLMAGVAFGF